MKTDTHIVIRVVRKVLTDNSFVYDVVLTDRECVGSIVLNTTDENNAWKLYNILINKKLINNTVMGGSNY